MRPFPRLRSLLCLAQLGCPLFVGVVLYSALLKARVSDFELSMPQSNPVASPVRSSSDTADFADWAKEGSGHLSTYSRSVHERKRAAHSTALSYWRCRQCTAGDDGAVRTKHWSWERAVMTVTSLFERGSFRAVPRAGSQPKAPNCGDRHWRCQ